MRKVDIWFGCGGYAELLDGFLLSDTPSNNNRDYKVLITSKDFLDSIGFEEPWKCTADKLGEDCYVCYDGFSWSEPGEVKADENGTLWPIPKIHTPTPKEIALRETVIALTNHFDNSLKTS